MTFQAMTSSEKPNVGKKAVHSVKLTLEELFHGCLKKVHFQRRRIGAGDTMEVELRELTIDVKPGLPEGTCFVFEGYGPCHVPDSCLSISAHRFERFASYMVRQDC
jgi:DnaJ homolog subfamily B member 13